MSTADHTAIERSEEALSWAGVAAVGGLRVAEIAAIVVAALLVVPPLAILVVVVVVPLVALATLVGLVAAAISLPVFVVRHAHRHHAAHAHRLVARAQRKLYVKPTP